jgi:hypothetical protein
MAEVRGVRTSVTHECKRPLRCIDCGSNHLLYGVRESLSYRLTRRLENTSHAGAQKYLSHSLLGHCFLKPRAREGVYVEWGCGRRCGVHYPVAAMLAATA